MWSGHKSFLRIEMGTPFVLSISLFHTHRLTFLGCYDYESERNTRNSTVDHLFVENSFKVALFFPRKNITRENAQQMPRN